MGEHATDKLTETFKTGLDDFSTVLSSSRFIKKEKADEIQNKLKMNIDEGIDKGKLDIFIFSIKAKRALRNTQKEINKAVSVSTILAFNVVILKYADLLQGCVKLAKYPSGLARKIKNQPTKKIKKKPACTYPERLAPGLARTRHDSRMYG